MECQDLLSDVPVIFCSIVLCVIISVVQFPWPQVDLKLLLEFFVSQPMESHFYCLGTFWLHLSVDNAFVHCVVGLEWHGRLFVDHFLQDDKDVHGFSCHDLKGH